MHSFIPIEWGRNSSVGSAWARCPQRRGFDPPLGKFSGRGDFPLELTWVQTPFPQEYKPRSNLCRHAFHRTHSKDPDVHSETGECRQQKHTQHALSTKTECDYLNGWIKRSHTQKSHPKVNPRDIAGERKKTQNKKNHKSYNIGMREYTHASDTFTFTPCTRTHTYTHFHIHACALSFPHASALDIRTFARLYVFAHTRLHGHTRPHWH